MPKRRNIYLKIEKLPGHSPVAPDDAERDRYRLDCMFSPGHETGRIPDPEVELRRLDAVVYREYLDATYSVLNTAPEHCASGLTTWCSLWPQTARLRRRSLFGFHEDDGVPSDAWFEAHNDPYGVGWIYRPTQPESRRPSQD